MTRARRPEIALPAAAKSATTGRPALAARRRADGPQGAGWPSGWKGGEAGSTAPGTEDH